MNTFKAKNCIIYFAILLVSLFTHSCSKIDLDKHVEGKDLTKEFCIDLVQNHWNCSNLAYIRRTSGTWNATTYDCRAGAKHDLIQQIKEYWDNYPNHLDRERSYYQYRVLYLHWYTGITVEITVNF
ncbi:MAG: hypothetical protein FWH23_02190 [Bacteroidales bacterium]|nr:hypothetical protein [Bacteroidales bacterium]